MITLLNAIYCFLGGYGPGYNNWGCGPGYGGPYTGPPGPQYGQPGYGGYGNISFI